MESVCNANPFFSANPDGKNQLLVFLAFCHAPTNIGAHSEAAAC
jgi:hypothetical protein